MKTFILADLHFGHKNIITFEKRPFSSIEEMDKTLINNWNSVVDNIDTVFIAGDYSFYSKEKTQQITSKLNGKKILIKGNHDDHPYSWFIDVGIHEVYNYQIIYNDWFIIQHEPPEYFNDCMPYFYFYGHVHSTEMYKTITKQSACVSAERWNYTPVEIEYIIKLSQKEDKQG